LPDSFFSSSSVFTLPRAAAAVADGAATQTMLDFLRYTHTVERGREKKKATATTRS